MIDLRPASQRFTTRIGWLDSAHSFSFGRHYDPGNVGFGLLLVSNDDRVAPGSGFSTHPHRDMEIVTWVLSGELAHQDSHGHAGLITPGLAQRMSAGTGIQHSEINATTSAPVHFVQMWVRPDTDGVDPGYGETDVSTELASGGWVAVAAGPGRAPERSGQAALRIGQRDAVLWAARPPAGTVLDLPDAPFVHVFVAAGSLILEGAGALVAGDAARLTGAGGPRVTAGPEGAELLVWEMHSR